MAWSVWHSSVHGAQDAVARLQGLVRLASLQTGRHEREPLRKDRIDMALPLERPDWMTEDLQIFEDTAVKFTDRKLVSHVASQEGNDQVPRAIIANEIMKVLISRML